MKTEKDMRPSNNHKEKNLKSFDSHLNEEYGKKGSSKRDNFEKGFEAFKIKILNCNDLNF